MVTEDYCSKDLYKLLLEKGFDGEIHTTYDEKGYTQPSISLYVAMKWLREKYSIHIEIAYNMKYFPVCISIKTNETIPYIAIQGEPFTYEQAAEAAIKYCLNNLI